MKNKLICIVGLSGAGKSEVSELLIKEHKFGYFRFGQIVLDKVKEMGVPPSEKLEREIREGFRKEHGMAAFAILNEPRINELLKSGDVIGDNLISWEEYLYLKDKYKEDFVLIAVYAPPTIRYERLHGRADRHGEDKNLRFRSFTKEESAARDKAQIENIHQAGPISMADYTIINISDLESLKKQVDTIMKDIFN